MFYAEYGTYITAKYITIQEAVEDMVKYMIDNGITDEFKVYRTLHIDAKSVINPITDNDILYIIQSYAKKEYGEEANGYLDKMDIEARKYFRYALDEYKKALTSWIINYHLEPTWERLAVTFIYKYDEENKIWKYVGECIPDIESIKPDEPIEPIEPIEPDEPIEESDEPIEDSTGE